MPHDTEQISSVPPGKPYASAIRGLRRQMLLLIAVSVILPLLYFYAQAWLPMSLFGVEITIAMVLSFVGIDAAVVLSSRRRARAAAGSEA